MAPRPYTKAPPLAPVMSWTGWYVGLNAGAGITDTSYNLDPTGCFITAPLCGTGGLAGNPARSYDNARPNKVGFTGGGQFGYNYQFSPRWVAGFEADINYNDVRNSDSVIQALGPPLFAPGSFIHTVNTGLNWFGTARGRIGYLVTPSVLLYGTGGLAYGQAKSSTNATFPFPGVGDTYIGSMSTTRVGWTAGAGGEWMVSSNWSVKAEYLYVDLGRTSYTSSCNIAACLALAPNVPTYLTTVSTREHIARVGVNYHLNNPVGQY
jgi:outer membrane immunogenic protein